MAKYDYQYGTSPLKVEPEYQRPRKKKTNNKQVPNKKSSSKSQYKKKSKNITEKKRKLSFEVKFFLNSMLIFVMVFATIACQALVEQRYKEKERLKKEYSELLSSSVAANDTSENTRILATEYGMQTKGATLIDLGTTDYVETSADLVKTEESLWDKIVKFWEELF